MCGREFFWSERNTIYVLWRYTNCKRVTVSCFQQVFEVPISLPWLLEAFDFLSGSMAIEMNSSEIFLSNPVYVWARSTWSSPIEDILFVGSVFPSICLFFSIVPSCSIAEWRFCFDRICNVIPSSFSWLLNNLCRIRRSSWVFQLQCAIFEYGSRKGSECRVKNY